MCQNTTCDIKESNSYVHNFKKQEWKQSVVLEFFFIFSFQIVYIKMEDSSKTPGEMSTVSGPGAGGPGAGSPDAGGPDLAIKQPMIYICGECHAGMVTKAFL